MAIVQDCNLLYSLPARALGIEACGPMPTPPER